MSRENLINIDYSSWVCRLIPFIGNLVIDFSGNIRDIWEQGKSCAGFVTSDSNLDK
jgi:hypothetical protein